LLDGCRVEAADHGAGTGVAAGDVGGVHGTERRFSGGEVTAARGDRLLGTVITETGGVAGARHPVRISGVQRWESTATGSVEGAARWPPRLCHRPPQVILDRPEVGGDRGEFG